MVIPELRNLTVGRLKQILVIKVDEGVVPVGGIGATYEERSSTHGHNVTRFANIQKTARKKTGTPVYAVQVPFRYKEFYVWIGTLGYHLRIAVILLSQTCRTGSVTALLLVVVQAHIIKIAAAPVNKLLVLLESAAGNDLDRGVYLAHLRTELAYGSLVLDYAHLPHLVVNLPVFHIVRRRMSVGRTLGTPLSGGRLIAIAQPVKSILQYSFVLALRTVKAHSYHNDRLGIDLPTKTYEFIGAETVLVIVHPHPVRPAYPLLLRTYSPFPVVLGNIAAAGPSEAGGMKLLYSLQNIGTESSCIQSPLG